LDCRDLSPLWWLTDPANDSSTFSAATDFKISPSRLSFPSFLPGDLNTLFLPLPNRTTLLAKFFPKAFHRPFGTAHFIRRFFEREIFAPDVHDHLRAHVEFVHQREELVKQTHQFFGTKMMICSALRNSVTGIERRNGVRFTINVSARCVLPSKFVLKPFERDGAENLPEAVVVLAAKTVTTRQRDYSAKRSRTMSSASNLRRT
jgi:hypothetical protein